MTETSDVRRVLMLAHTGRAEARDVARAFCKALTSHGIVVRLLADEASDLDLDDDVSSTRRSSSSRTSPMPARAASWPW